MRCLYALALLFLSLLPSARAQHVFQTFFPGLTQAMKRPSVQMSDGGFCFLAKHVEEGTMNSSMVVLKTTADGNVEWAHTFSTAALNDHPIALRLMPDGGFIAVGVTSVTNSTEQDILVLRLNAHGYPLWSRVYDYSTLDWASDAVVLANGDAIIVGSTLATDSAALHTQYGPIVPEEMKDDVYSKYTTERTLAFRIDSDGEVRWGGYVKETMEKNGSVVHYVSQGFAEAACRRNDNSITLVAQTAREYAFSSNVILNISDDGKASSGLLIQGAGTDGEPISTPFSNEIVPLPDGGCLIAGTKRYYTPSYNSSDEGLLLHLDNTNRLTWNRTYRGGINTLPLTIAPIDEKRFLIAGRTRQTEFHDADLDNPVMAVIDADGRISESTQWVTNLQAMPSMEIGEDELEPYLWWPLFIPIDDQGVLSVGTIHMYDVHDKYAYDINLDVGMLVSRFAPDLTLCGKDETHPIEVGSTGSGDEADTFELAASAEGMPLDVVSADIRISTRSELVKFEMLMPNIAPADSSDELRVEIEHWDNVNGMSDEPITQLLPTASDSMEFSTPVILEVDPHIDEGAYAEVADVVSIYPEENLEDDESFDDPDELEVNPYEETVDESEIEEEEEDEPTDWSKHDLTFSPIQVALVPLRVESHLLTNIAVDDFALTPFVLCGGNSMTGTSSAPSSEQSVEAEYVHLLPNSIQRGKSVVVDFRFLSDEKPEVGLVSAGLGEVVQRIDAKKITWSEAGGNGGATIETTDLPAGVYLVQVRSGEKQLTAKLEVR